MSEAESAESRAQRSGASGAETSDGRSAWLAWSAWQTLQSGTAPPSWKWKRAPPSQQAKTTSPRTDRRARAFHDVRAIMTEKTLAAIGGFRQHADPHPFRAAQIIPAPQTIRSTGQYRKTLPWRYPSSFKSSTA